MSYGRDANELSFCSAEFLSISRYFNPGSEGFNFTNGEVQMLSPSFVSPPINIRLRFEVTDPDGLHQVLLMIPQDNLSIVDCKSISGENATVEFVTDELHDTNEVHLVVVDVLGNIAQIRFIVDITNLLPTPEAISIPDTNLAAAIRENLDLASESQITAIDMLGLVTLFGGEKQIKDLTGLEHATNIERILLSHNQISDLTSLAGLKQLGELHLRENKIQDVKPLAGLTNLRWLELGENQISDITSLAGLTELTDLHLFNNQISDVNPLVELTGLNNLHLAGNSIKDIHPIAKLTSLEGLFLQENQISDIMPLTGLEKVKYLSLETNQISDISPISGFTQLTRLPLRNNNISNITPLAGLTQLTYLDLRNNNISDASPLTELIKLEDLDLIENPIKNREPLLTLLRKNPNVKIYLKSYHQPLPVTLSHFRAEKTALGVVLRWTTESEVDNAGFYIYHSQTKDGEFQVVNPKMIKGAGTTGKRNNYTWTDTTAKPNTVYYYRIEDISHAGVRQKLATIRLRGFISARGKLATNWANLKVHY